MKRFILTLIIGLFTYTFTCDIPVKYLNGFKNLRDNQEQVKQGDYNENS